MNKTNKSNRKVAKQRSKNPKITQNDQKNHQNKSKYEYSNAFL